MQIMNMPAHERPQEKLLFAGAGSLSNAELLALVIRNGTKDKSSIQLAEDVLAYVSRHIGDLGSADARELTRIDGIGEAKACSIVAAMELCKRLMSSMVMEERVGLSDTGDIARILLQDMMYEKRELFMSIQLNTRMQIESKAIISIGGLSTAPVHPREVFGPAIRRCAAAIIVAHNHPSGDPSPSQVDIDITERLVASAGIIGIDLLDHLIIGRNCYYSFREHGMISG